LETKGTIKKRRVITDEVPYCIFDGTNFREVMQFAKSQEIRVRWVDGDYQLTIEVDSGFYKIAKDDVLVDFGDELVCKDEKGFEEFIADNQLEPKDWYTEKQVRELREMIDIAAIDPDNLDAKQKIKLADLLDRVLTHIEELQNILTGGINAS